MESDAVLTGWYVGFVIGLVVITLVVILAGAILGLARRIGDQAEKVTMALDDARINTLPMFQLAKVNDGLHRITKNEGRAREALGG